MDLFIVQLKRDELILATFRTRRGGLTFLDAERHALQGGDEELERILRSATASAAEKRVVLALPPSLLFMREVELPIADRGKVREVLPMELKGETALDTDELSFDALPLGSGKFLAVWGRTKDLAGKIALLKDAGMEPEIVTASLFHWDTLAPPSGTVAISDGEALAAFSDGLPIYFRALPPGGGDAEVPRTVAALELARGVRVERTISFTPSGEAGQLPAGKVAETFGDDAHAAHDLAGAYAVAAAVAAGSVVNLRRGTLAFTAANEKLYRRLRVTAALAAVLVVALFAETAVRYVMVRRDLASLDRSVATLYREAFPTRKKAVDPVAELRAEIRKLEGAKSSSNVLAVLKELAEVKGDDVNGFFETEVDGSEVRLKGDARSVQAANDFRTRAAKEFDEGEVSEIRSRPDGSATFAFHGKIKGGGR